MSSRKWTTFIFPHKIRSFTSIFYTDLSVIHLYIYIQRDNISIFQQSWGVLKELRVFVVNEMSLVLAVPGCLPWATRDIDGRKQGDSEQLQPQLNVGRTVYICKVELQFFKWIFKRLNVLFIYLSFTNDAKFPEKLQHFWLITPLVLKRKKASTSSKLNLLAYNVKLEY